MTNKHIQSLINQVRADIATRKTMPEYGSTPDAAIERIKTINETQRSFSLETVEALLNALDAADDSVVSQYTKWDKMTCRAAMLYML